jgi:hypothetical protein
VGIREGLDDNAGDGLPDLLWPRRVNVRGEEEDLEAHSMAPLHIKARQPGTPRGGEPQSN